jgi:hypothetical protein
MLINYNLIQKIKKISASLKSLYIIITYEK